MAESDHGTASILVVDDTPVNLEILLRTLKSRGHRVRPVLDGKVALEAARAEPPSLVLLDIHMPGMDGFQVCAELKRDPRLADIPVIFISANTETAEKAQAYAAGGVDYVTKPFQVSEIHSRVETHLKLRRLQTELRQHQAREQELIAELTGAHLAAIVALAKLAEARDPDAARHVTRVQRFCRVLATRLAQDGAYAGAIDEAFVDHLVFASALHDIGKGGIADAILLKPGPLGPPEKEVMKTHAVAGAEAIGAILRDHPDSALLRMGVEIARSHHECWDGTGYPDGSSGDAIPLAARIVSVAERYDALRSKRPYKPALDAARARAVLTEGDDRSGPRQLDPRVLAAFEAVHGELAAIYEELTPPAA